VLGRHGLLPRHRRRLFSASALKLFHGGWFPLLLGAILFIVMLTWKRAASWCSRTCKSMRSRSTTSSVAVHRAADARARHGHLPARRNGVPHALLHNLLHNKVLHERVIFLTVTCMRNHGGAVRARAVRTWATSYQVNVHYGFKDEPDIPMRWRNARSRTDFEMMETSFFIARQTIISTPGAGMMPWREHLFVTMSRTRTAADYYQIPSNRVIELGTQVEI
jgi:KUP system potassium uptake protein